jgi:hypothetical protein
MFDVERNSGTGYRIGLRPRERAARPAQGASGSRPTHSASWVARLAYALGLVSLAYPFTISGWVMLTHGGAWIGLGFVAVLAFIAWRASQVLLDRRTLDAPIAAGFARWLRVPGLFLAGIGPVAFALQFLIGAIGRALAPHGSHSGVEFYVAGVGIALLAGLAPLGLLLFEFSRLRAFEQALCGDST